MATHMLLVVTYMPIQSHNIGIVLQLDGHYDTIILQFDDHYHATIL
jgi:hypothetical protein